MMLFSLMSHLVTLVSLQSEVGSTTVMVNTNLSVFAAIAVSLFGGIFVSCGNHQFDAVHTPVSHQMRYLHCKYQSYETVAIAMNR